jgi:hypothetical protein
VARSRSVNQRVPRAGKPGAGTSCFCGQRASMIAGDPAAQVGAISRYAPACARVDSLTVASPPAVRTPSALRSRQWHGMTDPRCALPPSGAPRHGREPGAAPAAHVAHAWWRVRRGVPCPMSRFSFCAVDSTTLATNSPAGEVVSRAKSARAATRRGAARDPRSRALRQRTREPALSVCHTTSSWSRSRAAETSPLPSRTPPKKILVPAQLMTLRASGTGTSSRIGWSCTSSSGSHPRPHSCGAPQH